MTNHKLITALVLCVTLFCGLNLNVEGRAPQNKTESVTKDTASLQLLEQARHNVLASINELPNFIVEQTVNRYIRKDFEAYWHFMDMLEIEVTFQQGKGEQFNLQRINSKPAQRTYESLYGSTSIGDFNTVLAALFLPRAKAHFEEQRHDKYRGRQAVVYEFKVLKENSSAVVNDKATGLATVAGYSGRMWVDAENKGVLRLELNYNDLPAEFPVNVSRRVVEYDWVAIGDQRYLLPINVEVVMGSERDYRYTRNVIKFSNYHKFESKMKVLDQ